MVDDGFSGTDPDRPGFKRLISEVTDGNVNCIIVKDLSRFSRDYVVAGTFLERIFPVLGVRFISINDNIDSSDKKADSTFIMSLKNIINDAYNRDLSIKSRSSLETKRKEGEFVGAAPTYGYLKSPDDHNKLIIDQEAAKTVKQIFS